MSLNEILFTLTKILFSHKMAPVFKKSQFSDRTVMHWTYAE